MELMTMDDDMQCWCGNTNLLPFSDEYVRCAECETLKSLVGLTEDETQVHDDSQDFYGKQYWEEHQSADLGQPDIFTRSRTDLPERCLHWLETLLRYKLPPASVLELGCAHGGFVYLLKQAGYSAEGLELSPSIVDYAKKTFDIPVYTGFVEDQGIPEGSLDMIVLMDVIEHLPHPKETMQHCLNLLKDDGVIIVQCPCYVEGTSHRQMLETENKFLNMLIGDEHLFLFSKSSITRFFSELGIANIQFEKAMFDVYDMFFVVGKKSLQPLPRDTIEQNLSTSPEGRIIQALLDQKDDLGTLKAHAALLEINAQQHITDIRKLIAELEQKNEQISMLSKACDERLAAMEKLAKICEERELLISKLSND
jgi:2-polyprenyl-3-methyl-5-hydroxy-6-metoxy-1,4-benzoquinol methylase